MFSDHLILTAQQHIRSFKRSEGGIAGIEFGIWAAVIFVLLLGSLDFGIYQLERMRVTGAVNEATVAAFYNRGNLSEAQIDAIIRQTLTGQNVTVSTSCNGVPAGCTNVNRPCACLDTSSGAPQFTQTPCGNTCPAGETAGYFLSVDVTAPFDPVLNMGASLPSTIEQSVTVRLQ